MSDLQREIEALRDRWAAWKASDSSDDDEITQENFLSMASDVLTSILARCAPKAEEWRGPWKCEKCGTTWSPDSFLEPGSTHRGLMSGTNIECWGIIGHHERRR